MARRDQPERQRQQLFALLRVQAGRRRRVSAALRIAANSGSSSRADEAELLEELVIGRQVGEHLGHRRGDLAAGLDQILGQPDLVEHGAAHN